MNLHPLDEVAKNAEARMREGWTVYQQFNCTGCGVKQTMDSSNVFHTRGRCEECGQITNIERDGCNFMAVLIKTPRSRPSP